MKEVNRCKGNELLQIKSNKFLSKEINFIRKPSMPSKSISDAATIKMQRLLQDKNKVCDVKMDIAVVNFYNKHIPETYRII